MRRSSYRSPPELPPSSTGFQNFSSPVSPFPHLLPSSDLFLSSSLLLLPFLISFDLSLYTQLILYFSISYPHLFSPSAFDYTPKTLSLSSCHLNPSAQQDGIKW